MNYIDQAIEYLNKLNGLPAGALVLLGCVVLGYVLRFVKRFPNDGIPVAVILFGAVLNTLLADTRTGAVSLRVWLVRNILVGLVIGFAAWMLHNQVLSRLEDWLVGKLPKLGGTAFFTKGPDGTANQISGGAVPPAQSTTTTTETKP